jgi:hypothetical protein
MFATPSRFFANQSLCRWARLHALGGNQGWEDGNRYCCACED